MKEHHFWLAMGVAFTAILIACIVGIALNEQETKRRMKAHGYIRITVCGSDVWCKPADVVSLQADPVEAKP